VQVVTGGGPRLTTAPEPPASRARGPRLF